MVERHSDRVAREQNYYETVYEESAAIQRRLRHVFDNPNVAWAEAEHRHKIQNAIVGKHVLDYGCGNGDSSAELLRLGAAHVTGVDLSVSAIDNARKKNLGSAEFVTGDAHNLPWQPKTFEVVVGRAILHHLNVDIAAKELVRVTAPGGELFFVEPLADNPGTRLFRAMTPRARTIDEAPLSRADVNHLNGILGTPDHHYGMLSSMAVGLVTSFIPGAGSANPLLRLAHRFDMACMRTPLKWWMGQIYLHWTLPRA